MSKFEKDFSELRIITGSQHYPLFNSVVEQLLEETGPYIGSLPKLLVKSNAHKFSNENIKVKIEDSIRGCDVYVVQPCYPDLNERIMELLILIDALKNALAERVTVVLPYYPYVRSDKKDDSRISITARLIADLLPASGADRVITLNLHSPQIQGFFRIPVDHLLPGRIIYDYFTTNTDLSNTVIVAPDAGSAKMVSYYSKKFKLPFAMIDKRRTDDTEKPQILSVVGDVKDKNCLIFDDEISTGNTLFNAVIKLKSMGANSISACLVHGVLHKDICNKLDSSPIDSIFITDTIYRPNIASIVYNPKIKIISLATMFSKAILCTHLNQSMTDIFDRYQI